MLRLENTHLLTLKNNRNHQTPHRAKGAKNFKSAKLDSTRLKMVNIPFKTKVLTSLKIRYICNTNKNNWIRSFKPLPPAESMVNSRD